MMVAISSNDPRLLDVAAAVPQTTYGSAAERIFWSQQQQQYPSTRVKKKSTPDIHKQYSEERRTDATALSEERQRLYQYKAPDDEDSTRTRSIHTATTTDNNNNNTILCGSPPLYETYFGQPKRMTRSMSDEDATIYNLFFRDYYTSTPERNNNNLHPKDATAAAAADDKAFHYVELGAFNGITESNTRFYDECLGWEGYVEKLLYIQ